MRENNIKKLRASFLLFFPEREDSKHVFLVADVLNFTGPYQGPISWRCLPHNSALAVSILCLTRLHKHSALIF